MYTNEDQGLKCPLCLEVYSDMELISLLSCGHYLHHRCYIRQPLEYRKECGICKAHTSFETNFIYKKDIVNNVNMFDTTKESMEQFNRLIKYTRNNKKLIFELFLINMKDKRRELFSKQQEVIAQYTRKLIPQMKIELVRMANTGIRHSVICTQKCFTAICDTKTPLIYYIYGPASGGLDYLKNNNVNSLIEELRLYFKKDLYEIIIIQSTDRSSIDIQIKIL